MCCTADWKGQTPEILNAIRASNARILFARLLLPPKAATLWGPEYPNVPRYLDGWYRLNPKCPRDPVLPFYDVSLRGFLPIHAHHCATHTRQTTYPVSQIWQITNSVDHMDTTAHTAHFYKPHMNSIDNVQHWTCDQACLTTATYVVCECACCHLTQIYSYIFLEQGCFCRVMQQRFFPLRCQHLPRAHWIIFIFYITHQLIIFYYWASPVRVKKSVINWLPNLTLWLAVKREPADTVKNMRAEH